MSEQTAKPSPKRSAPATISTFKDVVTKKLKAYDEDL